MSHADHGLIRVAARFCGPPESANGGYICGLVAECIPDTVTVRLLRPPPLDTTLTVQSESPGLWSVEYDGMRYMEARSAAPLKLAIPPSPGYPLAQESGLHGPSDPDEHPCPGCFVCGPDRAAGDGLRIFAGPVAGQNIVATAWVPPSSLAGINAAMPREILSAALDCPGFQALRTGRRPWLLGEFTTHMERAVLAGEHCVVVGWKIEGQGRKQIVGTALFGEDQNLCAWARGTWIEPRPPAHLDNAVAP